MLTVDKLVPQGRGLAAVLLRRAARVRLDWDLRQRSRFEATDSQGRRIGVFLARGQVVRGGDALLAEDGSLIVVEAAAQAVMAVQPKPGRAGSLDLMRAAYHLGNRHVALAIEADRLVLEPDPVLAGMLRGLGLHVEFIEAPFEPEAGAYGQGGAHPAHGHGADPGPGGANHEHEHRECDDPAHQHQAHQHHGHEHQAAQKRSHEHDVDEHRPRHEHAGEEPVRHAREEHEHPDCAGAHAAPPGSAGARAATAAPDAAESAAPHRHGPGCGHDHPPHA